MSSTLDVILGGECHASRNYLDLANYSNIKFKIKRGPYGPQDKLITIYHLPILLDYTNTGVNRLLLCEKLLSHY